MDEVERTGHVRAEQDAGQRGEDSGDERDPGNQPTLEIDAAEDSQYGILAKVLATAKNAQMQKIGFVKK